MATTPHGAWQGCPHFGFRNFLEQARGRPDSSQMVLQEVNLALKDLGVLNFWVESITREAQQNRDVDSYVFSLASTAEPGKAYSLNV
jgi:hypothetical protein